MPGVPICPSVAYMCSNGQRLHHPGSFCNYSPSHLEPGGCFPFCRVAPSSRRLQARMRSQSAMAVMDSTKATTPPKIISTGQKIKAAPLVGP